MHKGIINFASKSSNNVMHQTDKVSWYVWLLVLSTFLRCYGLYQAFDVIYHIHVINFVWEISLICSLLFGVLHRPFASGTKVKLSQWLRIARYALIQNVVLVLFFYGLSQVGPLRASLLSENRDVVILTVYATIFKGAGGPRHFRGSVLFIFAILSLLLFDNDSSTSEHPEGHRYHGAKHAVFYVISWMGLSDHEGGILVLLMTSVLVVSLNRQSRSLASELGGQKRFNAIAWLASFCILSPLTIVLWLFKVSSFTDVWNSFQSTIVISLLYCVFPYYVASASSQKLSAAETARGGTVSFLAFSLLLSFLRRWTQDRFHDEVSGGALFCLILFCVATMQLTSAPNQLHRLDKNELLPFHHFSSDVLNKSHSVFAFLHSTLRAVLEQKNSRTIFYFLCINLVFTFVEITFGMRTNSLGLISDGFHMLFDCSALVMGLTAAVMAQWKPSKRFPFGYGRIEVLSGFVNGLFLSVIGFMVFLEAIARIFEPPPIRTERLLAIAVCGLFVNVCGILAFSLNGHSHSHSHGLSHGHNHGHSHHSHGHSHSHSSRSGGFHGRGSSALEERSHLPSHNANMEGVFLHILADTLGSVAVILSSVLIDWYGWLIADPICSLILSVLILSSVLPLLKKSGSVLLLGVPAFIDDGSEDIIDKVLQVESVLSCENPHFWEHCGNVSVATMHVYVSGEIPEQRIISKVNTIFQTHGFSHTAVQVEVATPPSRTPQTAPSSWELGSVLRIPKNVQDIFAV